MQLIPQIAATVREWPTFLATPSGASVSPITYPTVPLVIKAELFLGGDWVDITSGPNGIYYETRIKIKRGRDNEATRAQPSKCTVKLKNPNRVWSPRNPTGPYYGKLGRNVKLRITVNPGDGDHVRFTGYVSKWPQEWTTGNNRWVSIEANGIIRRLSQGKAPLRSAIFRSVTPQNPSAFWPLDDASNSLVAASALTDGEPMVPALGAALGGTSDTPSGARAVVVNAGTLTGRVVPVLSGNSDGWIFSFAMRALKVPAASQPFVNPVIAFFTDSVDVRRWDLILAEEDPGFPSEWDAFSAAGTIVGTATGDPFASDADYNDQWKYYQLVGVRTGLSLTVSAYYQGGLVSVSAPIALTSPTAGNITDIVVNPDHVDMAFLNIAVSSISVLPQSAISTGTTFSYPLVSDADAFAGWPGERPPTRFARLCAEENIPYTVVEVDPDTQAMGPQGIKTFMDLIRECEATNEGVLDEDTLGNLRLISRTAFFNQPPQMLIDYTSGAIKPGFLPTDDDLLIRNDWTITRDGGSARQYVQTSGPLNVNDPLIDSSGVSKYDDSATLSLTTDDQAADHAAWRVARGTVDEMRIATLPLHFKSTPSLLQSWLTMDLANTSRFLILNPPAEMGSVTADQIMTGYDESIDRLEWTVSLRGAPASVEQINLLDQWGYLDCGACYLAEDLDTTETSIDVVISDTCTWTASDGPYDVLVNGEAMTVTAVSAAAGAGSSWTQTLTVVRSANGIVKSHTLATMTTPQKQVNVVRPFILAL